MFTGIIQAVVPLIDVNEKENLRTHHITLPQKLLSGLTIGASVAHNGCCLTVINIQRNVVSFDLIQETLTHTNLGILKIGDKVNLERAVTFGADIGGHLMSGHIFSVAKLTKIITSCNNKQLWFTLSDKKLMKYILYKGYIGLDGISLTVGEIVENNFCVYLIPETIRNTLLGTKQVGELINIEVDQQIYSIVNTVERIIKNNKYQFN